jgi:hypothetical protein
MEDASGTSSGNCSALFTTPFGSCIAINRPTAFTPLAGINSADPAVIGIFYSKVAA